MPFLQRLSQVDTKAYLIPNGGEIDLLAGPTGTGGPTGSEGPTGAIGSAGGTFGGIYGSFISLTTQTQTSANTPKVISFDITEISSGVSLSSATTIQINADGIYKIAYSIQLDKSGGGKSVCDIWLRIDGNDVPRSASQVVVDGQTGETFPFCEYIVSLSVGQTISFVFASSDATMAVSAFPAITSPYTRPSIPSIIANVYRIGA